MSTRRRRFLIALTLLCLCLAGAERGGRWLRSRYLLPTRGAEWIWAENAVRSAQPIAVWAVRDVDVGDHRPERARLLVSVDEEYVVWVNGRLVGAGEYAVDAPMDELVLDGSMKVGWNRILVELRSERGAGGFLAALWVGGEADDRTDREPREPLLRSDSSWRIYRQRLDGLLEGWLPADGGEPAAVWQVPPTGRWPAPVEVQAVPPLSERVAVGRNAERIVALHDPCLPPCRVDETAAVAESPDTAFLLDFGESGVGFLELELQAAAGCAHEVRLGRSLAELSTEDAVVLPVIPFPGSPVWRAARAAHFRYALLLGVDAVSEARILPVVEEWQSRELARGGEEEGLFGIRPRAR